MKSLFVEDKIPYTGEQLKPLSNYLSHGLLGTSIVSWIGPCDVPHIHMIDVEDLRAQSLIQGAQMLHFVIEAFDFPLKGAVVLQRLMAEMAIGILKQENPKIAQQMHRSGDDIYWNEKKFNISIATRSAQSSLIHFAVNVTNQGTPVPTCALSDFSVDAKKFAQLMMEKISTEFVDIIESSFKVKTF